MDGHRFKKILTIGLTEASLDPGHWNMLDACGVQRVSLAKDSPDIMAQLRDADCLLVVPFGFSLTKEHIDAAPNLRYIGVLSTGFAKVDVAYAKTRKIPVCNIPGYSTESVAEFVLAALLEHIRGLEEGKSRARKGNYSEAGISATEIKGKVFGIVGLGMIGARVAEIALGFGADVRYWSRNRKMASEHKGIRYQELDTLIAQSDFISITVALAAETHKILNEQRIQSIKPGSVVINTSPMELVDMSALDKRLAQDDMTFIFDHSDEMSPEDCKTLSKHRNCVFYPPIAYITKEAAAEKQRIFVENVTAFLSGKPQNIVN